MFPAAQRAAAKVYWQIREAKGPLNMISIDLTNKISVITGATGELGRVIVATLANAGSDVVIHYHQNAAMAAKLQQDCVAKGVRALTIQADVTDRDSVVDNAVIQSFPWQSVLEEAQTSYEAQFRSCVLHNVFMAQAFVPDMIKKGWGRVIGINTECAMQMTPSQSAYASAKRGMDGVLRVLAREVGKHGITVNQVAPGWMISNRQRQTGEESQPAYEKNVPLGHRGTDQDVANAVLFLASDLAAFITGVYLPVSGGTVMPCI
jgi:3-oxoacyl-[acyl-carrier protein] reductase